MNMEIRRHFCLGLQLSGGVPFQEKTAVPFDIIDPRFLGTAAVKDVGVSQKEMELLREKGQVRFDLCPFQERVLRNQSNNIIR